MQAPGPPSDDTTEADFFGVPRTEGQPTRDTGSSGWQFSAGPAIPEWPQRSNEHNFTSDAFGTAHLNTGSMNNNWDFSADSLWNPGAWEEWDLDLGEIMPPHSGLQDSVSPSEQSFPAGLYQEFEPAKNREPQNEFVTARESPLAATRASTGSRNIAGKRRASAPARGTGRPPGRRSNLLRSTTSPTASSIPGTMSLGRMQQLQESNDQLELESGSSTVSRSTASPKPPDQLSTPATTSSRQSRMTTKSTEVKGKRYHKDTERQYRLRLNDRFSELLKALPEDLVESTSGYSGRSEGDKNLTKIEILALAKSHIATLERAQAELEEESLVLRGQQELFKRLCGGLGGNNTSNIM